MEIVAGILDNANLGVSFACSRKIRECWLTPEEAEKRLVELGYIWIEHFSNDAEYEEFLRLTPYERLLRKVEESGGYEIVKAAGCFSFV